MEQFEKLLAFMFMGLCCTPALMARNTQKAGKAPNIVFILCDDLGYGDVACYGQPYIQTPNIDNMAKQGMLFTQAYAGAPVSAPSRATLLTGQHTGHTLVRGNMSFSKKFPMMHYGQNLDFSRAGQQPYSPDHVLISEIMKQAGYRTAMFGKWGGGYEGSVSTPDKRGFDDFYGYICQTQAHSYYPNFLNAYSREKGDTTVSREVLKENIQYPMYGKDYFKRPQYSADMIHQKAMEWLDKQDGKHPFIGFFTYTLPHAELVQPDDSLVEKYKRQFFVDKTWGGNPGGRLNPSEHTHAQFAAMVNRMDTYVGQVLQKLREKGLDKNTLVIFTSDNGPHKEGGGDPSFFGKNNPLKGIKRDCFEGGVRVPFIAWWPGTIKAGSVNKHQAIFYDMMPTFCELAGVKDYARKYRNKNLKNDYFDGISIVPTLLGEDNKQQSHEYLYWEFSERDQMGVRWNDWKLVVVKGKSYLFDLSKDIHEDHDIAAQHPDIVQKMYGFIRQEHTPSKDYPVTLPY